jgi:hypothetical protein
VDLRKRETEVCARQLARLGRGVLRGWVALTRGAQLQRGTVDFLLKQRNRDTQYQALVAWRALVVRRRAARQRAAELGAARRRQQTSELWAQWLASARQQLLACTHVRRRAQTRCRAVFAAWSAVVRKKRQDAQAGAACALVADAARRRTVARAVKACAVLLAARSTRVEAMRTRGHRKLMRRCFDALRTRLERRRQRTRQIAQAAAALREGRTQRVWRRWREAFACKSTRRCKAEALEASVRRRRALRVVRDWRTALQLRRRKHADEADLHRRLLLMRARWAVTHWQSICEAARTRRARLGALVRRMQTAPLRPAWLAWVDLLRLKREREAKEAVFVTSLVRRRRAQLICVWCTAASRSTRQRSAEAAAEQRDRKNSLRRHLRAWTNALLTEQDRVGAAVQAMADYRRRWLTRCFAAWKAWSAPRGARTCLQRRAEAWVRQRCLQGALRQMQHTYAVAKTEEQAIAAFKQRQVLFAFGQKAGPNVLAVLARWRTQPLVKAFAQLVLYQQYRKQKRVRQEEAESHFRGVLVARSVCAFVRSVARIQRLEAEGERARTLWQERQQATVLHVWAHEAMRLRAFRLRRNRATVRSAFAAWREARFQAWADRRCMAFTDQHQAQRAVRALQPCFAALKSHAARNASIARMVNDILRRRQQRDVRGTLSVWKEVATSAIRCRRNNALAKEFHTSKSLKRCFASWRALSQQRKRETRLHDLFRGQLLLFRSKRIFHRWLGQAVQKRQMRLQTESLIRSRERAALQWAVRVWVLKIRRDKVLAQTAFRIRTANMIRMMQCFRVMAEYARHRRQKRQRVRSLRASIAVGILARSFRGWKDAAWYLKQERVAMGTEAAIRVSVATVKQLEDSTVNVHDVERQLRAIGDSERSYNVLEVSQVAPMASQRTGGVRFSPTRERVAMSASGASGFISRSPNASGSFMLGPRSPPETAARRSLSPSVSGLRRNGPQFKDLGSSASFASSLPRSANASLSSSYYAQDLLISAASAPPPELLPAPAKVPPPHRAYLHHSIGGATSTSASPAPATRSGASGSYAQMHGRQWPYEPQSQPSRTAYVAPPSPFTAAVVAPDAVSGSLPSLLLTPAPALPASVSAPSGPAAAMLHGSARRTPATQSRSQHHQSPSRLVSCPVQGRFNVGPSYLLDRPVAPPFRPPVSPERLR